jgi:hypothetical protein
MIRGFFSFVAGLISHLMTFLVVIIVWVTLTADHQEQSSVFLESLLRQVAPLLINADVSAETLNVAWDRRHHTVGIRLEHASVIGHDVPVYASARRASFQISYGPRYPRWFMVDQVLLDTPEIHITVDPKKGETPALSLGSFRLGGLPLRQFSLNNGLVVIQQASGEKRFRDLQAHYDVISPEESRLTAQGTFSDGPTVVPFTLEGTGRLRNQVLETLTVAMNIDNALVPAPSAAATSLLNLRGGGTLAIDLKNKKATLTQPLTLTFGDTTLVAQGTATPETMDIQARLTRLSVNQLSALWPDELAAGGKAWVTQHITQGQVPEATLNLSLTKNEKTGFEVKALQANVALTGATVAYLPQMTPITGVEATVRFDLSGMKGTIQRAMMGKTPLTQGKVDIAGFDKDLQTILIQANLAGPLSDQVAEVMRAIPDDFKKAGLNQDTFGGQAVTQISVGFPLIDELAFSDVTLSATSDVKAFTMTHADLPLPVRDGNLKINFKNNVLEVAGQVLAQGIPADVVWTGDFRGEKAKTAITVDAVVPASFLVPHLPSIAMVTGAGHLRLEQPMGQDTPIITLDAKDMGISLTVPTFVKQKGAPLTLTFGGTADSRTFLVQGEKDDRASGLILQNPDGSTVAKIGSFTLGCNDLRAIITESGGHVDIQATGETLDLANFSTGHPEGLERPDDKVDLSLLPELTVHADTKTLHLIEHDFAAVSVDLDMRNNTIQRLLASGKSKTGKPFQIILNPDRTAVSVRSEDTTFLTETLGLQSRLQGGTLTATIAPLSDGRLTPETKIRAEMRNAVLKRAPIFGRILSLASLSGPLELLTGQGMLMNEINLDARLGKETFFMDNLEMKNASLGVFFTGQLGVNDETITGKGALVPAFALSRIVSAIPLLGGLLTSADSGIISISFSISGQRDDPAVTVNPLTSFTPGVLQYLFGMGLRD